MATSCGSTRVSFCRRIFTTLLVGWLAVGLSYAETVKIAGTGAALGTMRLLGEEFVQDHPSIRIDVLPYVGSSGAIKGVDSGTIDLGLSGRLSKPGEEKLKVRLSRYAVTPLVLAAHPGTGAKELRRDDLAAIYYGKKSRWDNGGRIRLILRHVGETDTEVLRTMSPEISRALDDALARPGMRFAATDQDAADALEQTPGAFGTSTLALVLSERRNVNILAVDGILPSIESLAKGLYPYNKSLYLVTKEHPSPAVKSFVNFIRSPRGQKILSKNGQLPVND